jgi:hypothetical protein
MWRRQSSATGKRHLFEDRRHLVANATSRRILVWLEHSGLRPEEERNYQGARFG